MRAAMVLALLGSLPATAQRAAPDQLARLIERVPAEDRRGSASRRLLELGAPAAAAITAALDPKDAARTRALIVLLGEMGPDAADEMDALTDLFEEAPEPLQPDVARVLTRLFPYLPRADYQQRLGALQGRLDARMKGCADEDLARRFAEEWFRTVQLSLPGPVAADGVEELAAVATQGHHQDAIELACELLGRKGTDADAALDTLRSLLYRGLRRSSVTTSSGKFKIGYESGPTSSRVVAAAILRIRPDGDAATEAHTYLLEHGLRHERWNALEFVRAKAPDVDVVAVRALIRVAGLAGAADDAELLAEVVTTLGTLGDAAAGAVPRLEELAADPDEALAHRASAALRAIRGRDPR